ncbi:hypothetical protein GCM10023238_08860 [Streptomyces heliomycini]
MAQGQLDPHGAAERTARVAEALHAERFEGGEQPRGEIGDRARGVGGGASVSRQIEPEHTPLLRQFGNLPVPHVPCGAQ